MLRFIKEISMQCVTVMNDEIYQINIVNNTFFLMLRRCNILPLFLPD